MNVSIVIPNYNGKELLTNNLPSVLTAKRNPRNNIKEVIVVDDASRDSSVAFLEKYSSEITIIRQKENRGFSVAVNVGVHASVSELVCLLNTDVIPEHDFLEDVIPLFQQEELFGVSLHEKGYGPSVGKFVSGFIVHSPGQEVNSTQETFWVNGGSGVFRKKLWEDLGGFDEKLYSPYYWEDVDISYRALKRGYKLLWEPKARVVHEHEQTMSKLSKRFRQRIQERNQLILIWKNLTSPRLLNKHLIGLFKRVVKNPGYIRIVFISVIKILVVTKSRNREKKEAKISDEAIFAMFK